MKLKKCKKCGSDAFIIQETILHEASLCPNDEELTVYKERGCGIERIICKNCNKDYLEKDFHQINFR
jgi:transposase-like protein